jgi:Tol biopolymer transport system component
MPATCEIPQIRVTRFPAWAPGTDIAFSSDGDIYATAEDGTNLRRLTETPTTESTPPWSPDGSTIAFELSYWAPASDR